MNRDADSGTRVAAAGLAAAAAATIPAILMMTSSAWPDPWPFFPVLLAALVIGFPIALIHVALLALPAYLLLRRRWRLSWWSASLAGTLIGALPIALLSMSWEAVPFGATSGLFGGLAFWTVIVTGRNDDPPRDSAGPLDRIFA